MYTHKNYELLKVVENTIEQCCAAHNVVNNTELVVEPDPVRNRV